MSSRARARSFNTVRPGIIHTGVGSATGTSSSLFVGSGGAANALADWVARSTGAGVTFKQRFTSSTDVSQNNAIYPDPPQPRVTYDATDGIIGDGCMKMDVPRTDDASSGAWRCPLNSAWVTNGQGFNGIDFYVQFRVKFGPSRLTRSNNGGGFKFMIVSEFQPATPNNSRSHPDMEIVANNELWRGILDMYRDGGAASFLRNDGIGLHIQSATDRGTGTDNNRYCLYLSGDASPGCWFLAEQQWFTFYLHLKLPGYGGSGVGNVLDAYVARQGETSYFQLFHNVDFPIGFDSLMPKGPNGLWLLPYDTNRTSASYDTWHKYDQVIVSTSPIACPQY